jgi:HSP20 family protein
LQEFGAKEVLMRLSSITGPSAEFDELVRRFVGSEPTWPTGGYRVPTDVFHVEGALVIRMDLPDVNPDEVEVTVQDNNLLINGRRDFPFDAEKVRFIRRGTFYGDFTQRVALGKGLDTEKIQARYNNGVLELMMPYAEEVKPRKIEIDRGASALTE